MVDKLFGVELTTTLKCEETGEEFTVRAPGVGYQQAYSSCCSKHCEPPQHYACVHQP